MAPNTPLFLSQYSASDRPESTPAPANRRTLSPRDTGTSDKFDNDDASWHGKVTTRTRITACTTVAADNEDPFSPSSDPEDPDIPEHVPKVPKDNELEDELENHPRLQTTMLALLGVEGNQEAIETQLAQMTNEETIAALLCTHAAVIKRLDNLAALMAGGPTQTPPVPNPVSPLFHEEQDYIRRIAREAMLDKTLEAYGRDRQERSLFRTVMAQLALQLPTFKRANLPPKYLLDDQLAIAHVVAQVKSQLKHVRHKARNVLLTGMNPKDPPGYIPPLDEPSRLLWRHFMGGNTTMSDDQVTALLDLRPLLCTWFAFLRLATIHNHVSDALRNVSQWDQINCRLAQMRTLPVNYTRHWHRMLCSKDTQLFGPAPMRADLDIEQLACPTHAEVNARIAAQGARE
ncbi:hypothetical protein PCASD_11538 [Puccinia coronata f. sp. avenae]|uniref:Uncharacterized protein n=1 Tax=Puccinia coronata f. sp. avenae TaxID=200324 RepID=A0A2N5ULV2_9BASI|nr:hypothetical protein PCASD_11538 [Puccinia coronata f. sp. avenae]